MCARSTGSCRRSSKAGYRVLVPYLRGYGPTRFRDPAAPRMARAGGDRSGRDRFRRRVGTPRFVVAGYDWGGRAAAIAAALHPDRVRATVLIGGYTIQNTVSPQPPAAPATEHRLWYRSYFNTDRGRAGLEANRRAICRYLWQAWSPTGASATTPTTVPRPHSTIRISWTWSSTRTGIASGTRPARRASRRSKPGWPRGRESRRLDHALRRRRRDRHPCVRVTAGRACGVRETGRAPRRPRRRPLHAA